MIPDPVCAGFIRSDTLYGVYLTDSGRGKHFYSQPGGSEHNCKKQTSYFIHFKLNLRHDKVTECASSVHLSTRYIWSSSSWTRVYVNINKRWCPSETTSRYYFNHFVLVLVFLIGPASCFRNYWSTEPGSVSSWTRTSFSSHNRNNGSGDTDRNRWGGYNNSASLTWEMGEGYWNSVLK